MGYETQRKEQLRTVAEAYFEGLRSKNFESIPFAENVTLRAPLAPGGVNAPLHGRENLRETWWAPLPGLLGEVRLADIYMNESLTAVVGEAEIEVRTDPPVRLRVADRFTVDDDGKIVEQVNHFDPRDLTNPGWQQG